MEYVTVYLDFMGEDFQMEVAFDVLSFGCPAKLYGPPENCWPAEAPEYDIHHIWLSRDVAGDDTAQWLVESSSAQFRLLANLPLVDDAICDAIADMEPPRRRTRRRYYGVSAL